MEESKSMKEESSESLAGSNDLENGNVSGQIIPPAEVILFTDMNHHLLETLRREYHFENE